jgi:hypothetical protein
MLEQIIVPNQYELAKLLPHFIRPEDFKAKGMSYFLIEPSAENTYKIDLQEKIYYDEMIFMEEVSLHLAGSIIYGLVSFLNNEIILGFRGTHMVVEYVLENGHWVLREYEDFDQRILSWAEEKLAAGRDFEELKKALG